MIRPGESVWIEWPMGAETGVVEAIRYEGGAMVVKLREETREEAISHLGARVQALYSEDAYFVPIPPGADPRSDFWAPRADPDGKVRDVASEHATFRDDYQTEIGWLREMACGHALDVGAGSGRMVRVLRELGWTVDAVEPDAHGAELCRSEGAQSVDGSVAEWRGRDASLVVALHVIEHMRDPVMEVRRMYEALRPGGMLLIGTPDFDCHTARRFGPRFRLLHDPTHVSLFSTDSLLRLLRDTGFVVRRVHHAFWEQQRFDKREHMLRQLDESGMSPAAPGNVVSVLCEKGR